jgi:CRP-like cAMP-binding protein
LLQYANVFDLLPLRLRNELRAKAKYQDFKRDAYVYRRGEDGDFLVAVMSGRLRLCLSSPDGKEILFSMIERGEMVGEVSVIDEKPRATDLIVDADSTLMIIYRKDFIPLLMSSPEAMISMMRTDFNWLRRYIHTIELTALQDVPLKFVHYLLGLARDYGEEKDGKIHVQAHLSQKEMAQQIGCSRESVNKQLAALIEKKLVMLAGDTIIINDIQTLSNSVFLKA